MANSTLTYEDYQKEKKLLDEEFSSSKKRRSDTYTRETNEENSDTEKALREKYIAGKLGEKRLPQIAAAKGLSGGYVKNAFRTLEKDYTDARESIIAERDRAIAKLTEKYMQGDEKDAEKYAKNIEALKKRYSTVLKNYQMSEITKKYPSDNTGRETIRIGF